MCATRTSVTWACDNIRKPGRLTIIISAGDDETDWHSDLRTAIAAEQGTDGAVHGGSGTQVIGFLPSADPAWRDADFKAQPVAGAPFTSYGYNSQQPDINEQGWLPR